MDVVPLAFGWKKFHFIPAGEGNTYGQISCIHFKTHWTFSSVLLDQDVGGALDFWPLLKSNTSRPHQYSLLINVKVFGHFHEKMVATSTEKI